MRIIIYTPQKAGTHLLCDMISLMINPTTNIYNKESMYSIVPHQTKRTIPRIQNRRICSTHPLYFPFTHKAIKESKLILITRHPINLGISRYFYLEKRKKHPKPLYYKFNF